MPEPKQIISPGQALLVLIDRYKNDVVTCKELKKLYFTGADTPEAKNQIDIYMRDEALNKYQISYEAQTINKDPSRRYFETHLCHETLKDKLAELSIESLTRHYNKILNMIDPKYKAEIVSVLEGDFEKFTKGTEQEYSDSIYKIKNAQVFKELTPEERSKILLLVQCSFLALEYTGINNAVLPLAIYSTGIFSKEQRGKDLLEKQDTTRSSNIGLMKSTMPTPTGDIVRSEVARDYLRPADASSHNLDAEWVKQNFSRLVHPFSNSISGTMLCQLRTFAGLNNSFNKSNIAFKTADQLSLYLTLFICSRLILSGGHTLYEFTAPLDLPEVKEEFKRIEKFNKINMEGMFHGTNEVAFDAALSDAIIYNKMILQRSALQSQISSIKGEEVPEPDQMKPS